MTASTEWERFVVRVDADVVDPTTIEVEGSSGSVADPDALHGGGSGTTTVTTDRARGVSVVVDLGRLVMGHVEVGVRRHEGAPLRVSHAEFRDALGPDGDGLGPPFGTDAHPWSRVDVFPPEPGASVLVSPGKREVRYLAITLDGPGLVELELVRLRQSTYRVAYDSSFLCSDETLTRAWYHSAHMGELATVTEDGSPWMLTVPFDRVLFMGDLQMQALAGYYQSSDYRWLARNTLQQFGCVQNPDGSLPPASSHLVTPVPGDPGPPTGWRWPEDGPDPDVALGFAGDVSLFHDLTIHSFTAFWVVALAEHLLYTGESEFARPLLPVARRAIEFLRSRSTADGLFVEEPDQRVDPEASVRWVANWSPGDIATGIDSFTNAVYVAALRGLALLEREVEGDQEAANALEGDAESVRTALLELLWDPEVGAMVLNDRDPRRDHTGDAVAGSLMFEALDPDQAEASRAFIDLRLATPFGPRSSEYEDNPYRAFDIQGYITAMESLGRVRSGDGHGSVDLIRRWWTLMLDHGPGTGWFLWNTDGSVPPGTYANTPWTTPIPALAEGVLGIRPTAPGYRRWRVAPLLSDLTWARGAIPVPGGALSVRWESDADRYQLTVDPPPQTEGEVVIPDFDAAQTITVDGVVTWSDGRSTGERPAHAVDRGVVFGGIRAPTTFTAITGADTQNYVCCGTR